MAFKKAIIVTLKETIFLYKFGFKIYFICALLLSMITEYFIIYVINSGLYKTLKYYIETGNTIQKIQYQSLIGFLGIISIIITIITYGLLICLGEIQFKNRSLVMTKLEIYKAFNIFKIRLLPFLGIFFINVITSALASIFGIIGIWLVTSFTFISFPMIILSKDTIFFTYKKTILTMVKNSLYSLQIGFISIILSFTKYIIYFIFSFINSYSSICFGIEHALVVFINAFSFPFIIMLMISSYHLLLDPDK